MVQRGFGQVIYGLKTDEKYVVELSELIEGYCEFNVMKNWSCRNHFNPSINFEEFTNKATLYLCKEKEREERVNLYWIQIKGLIDHYEEKITVANNVYSP